MYTEIIGIDPGPSCCGVVRIFPGERKIAYHSQGCGVGDIFPQFAAKTTIAVCEQFQPQGQPIGVASRDTIINIGRLCKQWELAARRELVLMTAPEWREILCDSRRAKDGNVRDALIAIYGEPGTKKNPGPTYGVTSHAWQALGIATAYAIENKMMERTP